MPIVSVIVPVFNRRDMLRRALHSIRRQTVVDHEVIVVDDGSHDDPSEVVRGMGDSRFRCLRQSNAGASAARNAGVRASSGQLIAFLDSDDEWLPNKLERQIGALRNSTLSEVGAVTCGVEEVRQDGSTRSWLPRHRGYVLEQLIGQRRLGIGPPYLLCKREIFQRSNIWFDESLPARQDLDFGIQLLQHYQLELVAEPLLKVHHHEQERVYSPERGIVATQRILRKHADLFARYPRARSMAHLRLAWSLIVRERWNDARAECRSALNAQPGLLALLWLLLASSQHDGTVRPPQSLLLRLLIRRSFGAWYDH